MRFTIAVIALALSMGVHAQSFPSKTVRFISGVTPGAASDTMARILAEKMSQTLGHSVIVENRLGAGGLVGAKYVAEQAEPDGHTIMMYASAFTVSTLLSPDVLNPKELQAVATVATIPTVMITPPGKYKTVKDFVDDAKKRPGKISYSSSGIFGALHMPFTLLEHATGTTLWHVPYNGGGPAVQALLGSQVDATVGGPAAMIGQIRAKKFRPLASFGGKRLDSLPEVPTLKELGIDAEYYIWAGIMTPAATPPAVQQRLREAVRQAVQDPDFRNAMAKVETPVSYLDAPEFRKYWDADARKLAEAVKTVKIVEQK